MKRLFSWVSLHFWHIGKRVAGEIYPDFTQLTSNVHTTPPCILFCHQHMRDLFRRYQEPIGFPGAGSH